MYRNTSPGGWVEFQDFDLRTYTQDNSAAPDNKVVEFFKLIMEACEKFGRMASPGENLKTWVEEAGFVNVQDKVVKLPIGPWPKDEQLVRKGTPFFFLPHTRSPLERIRLTDNVPFRRQKRVGALNIVQLLEGLEAVTIVPFTKVLGWSVEDVHAFLAEVRRDLKKRSVHLLHDL